MQKISRYLCILAVLMMSLPSTTFAQTTDQITEIEKLPLWEAGIVGVAARIPHYRGSDESSNYAFPLPYLIYRGKILKADRDGIRGIFWRNKRFETDISLSGNPPVSDDNKARMGMPELDAIFEIGPALRYYFYEAGERDSFFLQANIRAAFSIDFSDGLDSSHEGYISDLSLVYRNSKTFKEQKLRYHLNGGIQFADSDIHNFFYGVSSRYTTDDRPLYDAEGGYGGLQLSGSISKELTNSLTLGCYGKWINIGGAIFEDSPLVQTDNNYILGILLLWKIGQSEKFVGSTGGFIEQ